MPIDYKKYPKNWKTEIRPRILERAKNKCEFCGVENYKQIFRLEVDGVDCYYSDGVIYHAATSEVLALGIIPLIEMKPITVVLTIAHLNHNINDNSDDNLRALCQRCHLRYDAKHHAETRKRNKLNKTCN